MPLPKRRHSVTRRDKRRTHYKLEAPAIVACPSCGEPVTPHTACKHCGLYRNRIIIAKKEKEKKD